MKKLLFALALTGMLWSCGKDGEMGPKGDKGEQGQQGEKGLQGEKGVDGTTLLSGNGVPQLTIGKTGDYYIDLSTSNLYGPKTSTSWGQSTSMKGEKGDNGSNGSNGKDGSKILSGTGLPLSTEGAIGDFYFAKGYLAFYGPKTSMGWGSGVILGSTQAFGVQTFLIRGVKINASTTLNYTPSSDFSLRPFVNGSINIEIPGVNLKRGITQINVINKDNYIRLENLNVVNYDDFSWTPLTDQFDLNQLKHNHDYFGDNYRFSFNYYSLNKTNFRIQIAGYANSNIFAFNNWKNEISIDVLVKHIPESSATQIMAKGQNPQDYIKIHN